MNDEIKNWDIPAIVAAAALLKLLDKHPELIHELGA